MVIDCAIRGRKIGSTVGLVDSNGKVVETRIVGFALEVESNELVFFLCNKDVMEPLPLHLVTLCLPDLVKIPECCCGTNKHLYIRTLQDNKREEEGVA